MPGKLVAYLRVSTTDQNLERQRSAIGPADRVFEEYASGGSRTARPALDELLRYLREDDHLVVASMDRLARSLLDLRQLVDERLNRGVTVEYISERLTFSPGADDHYGRFQLHLLGAVAELERSLIRERQAEGIARAKTAGKYRGRARSLTATDVGKAQQRISDGVPKAVIARELGVDRKTLYRALTPENPNETGL